METTIINEGLPRFLSLRQAAEMMKVSVLTLDRWYKTGKVRAYAINAQNSRPVFEFGYVSKLSENTRRVTKRFTTKLSCGASARG